MTLCQHSTKSDVADDSLHLPYHTWMFLLGRHKFSDNETALKQIQTRNIQDNLDLTHRTVPTRPTHINSIPEVTETFQSVNMDMHFPRLLHLCTDYSKDIQIKTR